MIAPPQPRRRSGEEFRSQFGVELLLNAYALAGAAVVLRCLLLLLEVDDRLWFGATVYRLTDPLAAPLELLPGGDYVLRGNATLADLTLLAGLALAPLAVVALGGRRPRPRR